MNRRFLEFWGQALINAAKGQKQLEDMAKWLQPGFNFGDFTAQFRQAYGLDDLDKSSPDSLKMWKKAEEEFQESFREYFTLLGVVPREKHLKLVKKYEALKEKVADQEETINHLKMILGEKGLGINTMTLEFQKLLKKQEVQFQELIKGFGEIFKEDSEES